MPLRPCLDCGALTSGTRCPPHHRTHTARQTRTKRAVRPYTAAERQRRKAAVDAHRAQYGDWCPGYGIPAHPTPDLTADHVLAVGAGGAEHGPLAVLCRSCNGRKAARPGQG